MFNVVDRDMWTFQPIKETEMLKKNKRASKTVEKKKLNDKSLVLTLRGQLRRDVRIIKELQAKLAALPPAPKEFTWLTAEGDRILPRSMDEQHLRNTICFLQRSLVFKFGTARYLSTLELTVQALCEMLKEAKRRGYDV